MRKQSSFIRTVGFAFLLAFLGVQFVGCSDNSSTRSVDYGAPPSSDDEEMNLESSGPEQAPS